MPGDRIVEHFDIDASGAVRGGRQGESALERLGQASNKTEGRFAALGTAIKGFLVAQAAQYLAAYTMRLFDLGTAAQETASKFDTVFGPAASRLRGEIGAVANQMGLTRTEAEGFAATLGGMAQGFGLSQSASANFSNQILRLAGDLTSFSNVPIEETLAAIQSGLTGEQEPLRRFGILLNDAAVKAKAAEQTGRALSSEFTEQEKVMARLALITEKAGVANGDLARTADSAANTARRLSAEIRDQEQTFAQLLIPTFNLTLETLGQIIDENKSAAGSFSVVLARGILVGTNALLGVVRAGIQTGRAIFGLGQTLDGFSVGPTSPTARLLLGLEGIASALDIVTAATNFLSNGFKGAVLAGAQANEAWARAGRQAAIQNGDIEAAKEFQEAIEAAQRDVARLNSEIQANRGQSGAALRDLRDRFLGLPQGGAGAKLTPLTSAMQELEGMADNLGRIEGEISKTQDEIVTDLVAAAEDAGERLSRTAAQQRSAAEQARRRAIDKEFEDEELRIGLMREGNDREIAEINLKFRRAREAYERSYGEMSALITERSRALEQQEIRALSRRQVAPLPVRGVDRGMLTVMNERESPEERSQRLLRESIDASIAKFQELGLIAVDTQISTAGALRVLGGQYLATLSDSLSGFASLLQTVGAEGGKAFNAFKALAIASAIIDTYAAANATLRSTAPLGPVAQGVAVAGVIAAGIANVLTIANTQPRGGSGGGRGGGSRSSSGQSSSLSAGLSVGAGMSAGSAAGQGGRSSRPSVTVNPAGVNVDVQVLASPEGLYATTQTGQRRVANSRGTRAGLDQ